MRYLNLVIVECVPPPLDLDDGDVMSEIDSLTIVDDYCRQVVVFMFDLLYISLFVDVRVGLI
jgi:hypothetical protein